MFFEKKCKYAVKEKNISEYITHNIQISSDSDREDGDEEISNEGNSIELWSKILISSDS